MDFSVMIEDMDFSHGIIFPAEWKSAASHLLFS